MYPIRIGPGENPYPVLFKTMMVRVSSRVGHRRRMRIRQEAIFNSGVNKSCVEDKFLSPVASLYQKAGSKLDGISSRQVSITSCSDVGSNTEHDDENVCRNMRQDYKDDLVDTILTENLTESENEGSSYETLDDQSYTNIPERRRDFTTITLRNTGKFHQSSSEASTLTDTLDITTGNPLNLSPSYHDVYSFRSRGLTNDTLNG